jgi:hypothetical protein
MAFIDAVFGFIGGLPPWGWVLVLAGPAAGLSAFTLNWWFRRPGRWERAALEMGFSPLPRKAELGRLFPRLSIFAGAVPFEAETLWGCSGRRGRGEAWLADFSSKVGKQKRGRTVCVLRVAGAAWPAVGLWEGRPAPATRPIDGEWDDPPFDRAFCLTSGVPEAARALLGPDARAALVRLAERCRALERTADPPLVRLMLRVLKQIGNLEFETAGDLVAVCARSYLDPGVLRELLDATESAAASLGR